MNTQSIKKTLTSEKENGRIYTPEFIVNNILDLSNYVGQNILKKHVIDNSCGDGAFLCEIVRRYCECALKNGLSNDELVSDLETYIHGIELDESETERCIENVNSVVNKFVVRNYSQNSVNYFENMLGETANIRTNQVPYFQVFVIFEKVPYYKTGGILKKYDEITKDNLKKYVALSKDNPDSYYHTPDKTLIIILNLKEKQSGDSFKDSKEYATYYLKNINNALSYSSKFGDDFDRAVVLNDYKKFLEKSHCISIGKMKD